MHRARIGLTHHVEMALQDHAGYCLATGAGVFAQDQIACSIDAGNDAARLRPVNKMFNQCCLMQ